MTKHEWEVLLAATWLSNKAPVVDVPSHAIVAAEILRRAIRKNGRQTCKSQRA